MWRLQGCGGSCGWAGMRWGAAQGGVGVEGTAGGASLTRLYLSSTWLIQGCPSRVSWSAKDLDLPSLNGGGSLLREVSIRLHGTSASGHPGHVAQTSALCYSRKFRH